MKVIWYLYTHFKVWLVHLNIFLRRFYNFCNVWWLGMILYWVVQFVIYLHIIPSKFTVKVIELVLPRCSNRINWSICLNTELLESCQKYCFWVDKFYTINTTPSLKVGEDYTCYLILNISCWDYFPTSK